MLRHAVSAFVSRELPLARLRKLHTTGKSFERGMWEKMAETGWVGLIASPESGGSGASHSDLVILMEQLGNALAPEPVVPCGILCTSLLDKAPASPLRTRLLNEICCGKLLAGVAWQEGPNFLDSIEATRGRGTIVAREPRAAHFDEGLREAINQGNQGLTFARDETAEILSKSDVREIPAKFGIVNESEQRFCLIRKVHLHRKQPFSALDCLIDIDTFKRFPRMAYKKEKLLKVVYDLGVKLTSNRQEITLAYADSYLAKLLKCQIAAALVQVRSWRYDASGRLIFAAVIRYRGDQFIYDIVDGDAPASQNRALIIPKARAG